MFTASKRIMLLKAPPNDNEDQHIMQECDGEYISTDDAGSAITYIEEYTANENGSESEDGGYFVEYVDEDYQMIGELNDSENENPHESNSNLEHQTTNETDEQIDEYNCNLCGMNFASINDHVDQYHPGQDIIVDILDGNETVMVKQERPLETQESEEDCVSDTDPLDDEMIVYGEEGMETDNTSIDEYVDEKGAEVGALDNATGTILNSPNIRSNRKTTKASVSSFWMDLSRGGVLNIFVFFNFISRATRYTLVAIAVKYLPR